MAIAIHPQNNRNLLVGTVNNPHAFHSENQGESWSRFRNYPCSLSAARIIVHHPFSPDTVFMASLHGMFRLIISQDSWQLLVPPGYPYNEIRALAVHPRFPNIIFAGGPFGNKWRSTDGGVSWTELYTSGRTIGIDDFAIDPINDSVAYFVSGSMIYRLGVWKTTDLGQSWFCIHNNMDTLGFGEAVTVDPVDPQTVYVTKNSIQWSGVECVYKSTDGGASWRGITPQQLNYRDVNDIDVLPSDHNLLFICTANEGVFKSTDGGQSWRAVNTGLNVTTTKTIEIDTAGGIIYLGTYYDGIHKSTDFGETWQKISQNINLSGFRDIAFHPQDSSRFYILGMASYLTNDLGLNWSLFVPDVGPLQFLTGIEINRADPNNIYLSTSDISEYSRVGHPGFYYSSDCGMTWQRRITGLPVDSSCFNLRISYAADGGRRLFLSSIRNIYFSDNEGLTWQRCPGSLPTDRFFETIEVSNADYRMVATVTSYCYLYLSTDRGQSWNLIFLPSGTAYFNDLAMDPLDSRVIYLSGDPFGLVKTTDRGVSWDTIATELPHLNSRAINAITINPLNNLNLFVTNFPFGVFGSNDGGISWYAYNAGFDTKIGGTVMTFVPGDTTTIILPSSSQSVWSITRTATSIDDDSNLPAQITLHPNYPNPFNTATTFGFSLPRVMSVSLDIYDILGRKVVRLFEGTSSPGEHSIRWDASGMSSGIYFFRLTAGQEVKIGKALLVK